MIGTVLLRIALRAGRRYGLTSRSFWLTFRGYSRYRIRRIWPAALGLLGAVVVLAGAGLAFMWLLGYYAARLGHPVNPGGS